MVHPARLSDLKYAVVVQSPSVVAMGGLDHDIDAIIRTHTRDRKVAAWFESTAERARSDPGPTVRAPGWAAPHTCQCDG